jgi:hypothetical protein
LCRKDSKVGVIALLLFAKTPGKNSLRPVFMTGHLTSFCGCLMVFMQKMYVFIENQLV